MLRPFKNSDTSLIHKLIQETIDVSYTAFYPKRAVQFFKDYHSENSILERSQLGQILVIEEKTKIVATGSLVENEISGVFVNPSMQNMGLGKQIMLELEANAKKKGIPEIMLHVSLPSRRFYENLKYKISEPHKIDVGQGQFLKYWKGKKNLNS